MTVPDWLAGWRSFYRERRAHAAERKAHRDTRAAYDRLVVAHRRTLDLLHREEQRAADMALAATEPCEPCAVYMGERDEALHQLEDVKLRLDAEIATRVWCEGMLRGEVKP